LQMIGMIAHNSPVQSIAMARERQAIFGGNAPNGPASMIPWALNRLAGTKFKVVRGYPSENAEMIAIERGEIEGIGNAAYGDLTRHHGIEMLYVSGQARIASHPGVPTIVEAVLEPNDRPVMQILAAVTSIGLTLVAPPAVPAERAEGLRAAFDAM